MTAKAMSPMTWRRYVPWIIGLVFLGSLQAAADPDSTQPSAPKIMLLGDSITAGYAGRDSYRWHLWRLIKDAEFDVDFVGSVQSSPGYDFDSDHEGHWGFTTRQILDNLPSWLGKNTPDVVLLHLGTNDVHRCHDMADTANNTRSIIEQIHRSNKQAIVLLAKIIPTAYSGPCGTGEGVGDTIQDLNRRLNQVAEEEPRVIVVDHHDGFDVVADLRDGTHPNDRGFRKIAEGWFDALEPVLSGEH